MALPKEIEWNIIKFMSHPCADIIKEAIADVETKDYYWFYEGGFSSFFHDTYFIYRYCFLFKKPTKFGLKNKNKKRT